MAEDKPRLVRLASILTRLQSKRLVTATDISREHGISIRTVYRDIRTLEESGVPIITEEGRGYSMMDGYTLPPVMFTEEEANSLITAEKIIENNSDESFREQYAKAITKIRSILRFSLKEKTELLENRLQIRNNRGENGTSKFLTALQTAITNYEVIHIRYLAVDNKLSERHIEPFAIYSTHDNWILVAYCQLRKDFRAFRLDRIQVLNSSGKHFEPHQITLQEYFAMCRKKGLYP